MPREALFIELLVAIIPRAMNAQFVCTPNSMIFTEPWHSAEHVIHEYQCRRRVRVHDHRNIEEQNSIAKSITWLREGQRAMPELEALAYRFPPTNWPMNCGPTRSKKRCTDSSDLKTRKKFGAVYNPRGKISP
ncbi:hypothetical protein F4604DRAFT_1682862 [Suillus subluteus]|nr:hypothetical protein F4604DRAFT_1682862 [Suillus subluteus]